MPYLHVTTHIKDRPNDDLLRDKGGSAFPTLMFLDAEGNRLLKHNGARDPHGFRDSLLKVEEFYELKQLADAGNQEAANTLFLRQLRLEWFDYDQAKLRAAKLTGLTKPQQRSLAGLLINTEVRTWVARAGRQNRRQAGEHFAAMFRADRVPSTKTLLYPFWMYMALHAEAKEDKLLFRTILREFKTSLTTARYARARKDLKARLGRL